jgi:hypothetical protein
MTILPMIVDNISDMESTGLDGQWKILECYSGGSDCGVLSYMTYSNVRISKHVFSYSLVGVMRVVGDHNCWCRRYVRSMDINLDKGCVMKVGKLRLLVIFDDLSLDGASMTFPPVGF